MFTHYRTQGFIIKKNEQGEADRIFTVYTQDFGKLVLLAKAVRKIQSKLRGGLKLFSLSEIEFIQGKAHKTLTDTIAVENFDSIRKNLVELKIAYKIGKVIDSLIKEEEKDENIWTLINETFHRLDSLQAATGNLMVYYYFFWNLVDLAGYCPSVYNCSVCQKKLTSESFYFNPEQGGVICNDCFKKVKFGKRISSDLVKILRVILKKNWQNLIRIKINLSHFKALKTISEDYYSYLSR